MNSTWIFSHDHYVSLILLQHWHRLLQQVYSLFFAEPTPPTDVTFTVTGTDSAVVSWTASQTKCGAIANYSVMYQLRDSTGAITTLFTTETSVTLQGLVPNAEYTASVAAISSMGDMSAHSIESTFAVAIPTAAMATTTSTPVPTSTPAGTAQGDIHVNDILAYCCLIFRQCVCEMHYFHPIYARELQLNAWHQLTV